MIRCVRCGAENPDDNNFCDQCGSMLSTSKVESNGTPNYDNNPFNEDTSTTEQDPTKLRYDVSKLFSDIGDSFNIIKGVA